MSAQPSEAFARFLSVVTLPFGAKDPEISTVLPPRQRGAEEQKKKMMLFLWAQKIPWGLGRQGRHPLQISSGWGWGLTVPRGLAAPSVEKNLSNLLRHGKHYFPVKICIEDYEAEGALG